MSRETFLRRALRNEEKVDKSMIRADKIRESRSDLTQDGLTTFLINTFRARELRAICRALELRGCSAKRKGDLAIFLAQDHAPAILDLLDDILQSGRLHGVDMNGRTFARQLQKSFPAWLEDVDQLRWRLVECTEDLGIPSHMYDTIDGCPPGRFYHFAKQCCQPRSKAKEMARKVFFTYRVKTRWSALRKQVMNQRQVSSVLTKLEVNAQGKQAILDVNAKGMVELQDRLKELEDQSQAMAARQKGVTATELFHGITTDDVVQGRWPVLLVNLAINMAEQLLESFVLQKLRNKLQTAVPKTWTQTALNFLVKTVEMGISAFLWLLRSPPVLLLVVNALVAFKESLCRKISIMAGMGETTEMNWTSDAKAFISKNWRQVTAWVLDTTNVSAHLNTAMAFVTTGFVTAVSMVPGAAGVGLMIKQTMDLITPVLVTSTSHVLTVWAETTLYSENARLFMELLTQPCLAARKVDDAVTDPNAPLDMSGITHLLGLHKYDKKLDDFAVQKELPETFYKQLTEDQRLYLIQKRDTLGLPVPSSQRSWLQAVPGANAAAQGVTGWLPWG